MLQKCKATVTKGLKTGIVNGKLSSRLLTLSISPTLTAYERQESYHHWSIKRNRARGGGAFFE
jgi:hypothetical protein